MQSINDLTHQIIGAAMEVHRELGPGLLESAYEACLFHELTIRGIPFLQQVELPIEYKGLRLDCGYRMDLIVAERVIVEVKAVERLIPLFDAQVLTYLKLSGKTVGLILNSHVAVVKDGIRRIVLNLALE